MSEQAFESVFNEFDKNKDNQLSRDELKYFLKKVIEQLQYLQKLKQQEIEIEAKTKIFEMQMQKEANKSKPPKIEVQTKEEIKSQKQAEEKKDKQEIPAGKPEAKADLTKPPVIDKTLAQKQAIDPKNQPARPITEVDKKTQIDPSANNTSNGTKKPESIPSKTMTMGLTADKTTKPALANTTEPKTTVNPKQALAT